MKIKTKHICVRINSKRIDMLQGQITEIITSRAFVSFGGFLTFEKDSLEYKTLEKVFKYLSRKHEFYCNHVVLKIQFYNDVYYIGYNDNEIHVGNSYHIVEIEDVRGKISVNYRLPKIYREAAL